MDELLEAYDWLAIPHFQRGLVWDAGSVALLLESLYFGTPCGSILLWKPDDPEQHGVPLGRSLEYLIIDGQQRIRSLRGVFGDEDTDRANEGEAGDESQEPGGGENPPDAVAVWCLNVARLPELEGRFEDGERFRLFGLHRNPLTPAEADTGRPDLKQRQALLPLRWFLDREAEPDRLVKESHATTAAGAVTAVLGSARVRGRLADMRRALLFDVRVLGQGHDLKGVVSAYNRINSAGKRVEAEERAFARLVSVSDGAERELRAFFERCHPGRRARRRSQADRAGIERDDLVRREKENRFGFKLFMRAFVMAFAYHTDRTIGTSTFSFNSVDVRSLEQGKEHLDQILRSTGKLLEDVASILRGQLCCDDLRMLPDTSSLWPVLQCLIRFPDLALTCPDRLAAVILRLMVTDLPGRQLLELAGRVNEAQGPVEALAVFDGQHLRPRSVSRAIRDGVAGAQSLTDRYALILYWLLRKRGARDFSYGENLSPEKAAELRKEYDTSTEPDLSEGVTAQKQHLVPYSVLKSMFGLSGARPGRHEANQLGNLTYMSGKLNGLKGMSSVPLNLRHEPDGNRDAHLLGDRSMLDAFEQACGRESKASYRRFCRRRRQTIAEALVEWDAQASRTGVSRCGKPSGIPTRRLMAATLDDRIRSLKYSPEMTECLVALPALGFREGRKRSGEDGDLRLVLYRRGAAGRGEGRSQRVRIVLVPGGGELGLKVSDASLRRRFERDLPRIETRTRGDALRCSVGTRDEAGVRRAVTVLKWLAFRLSRSTLARGKSR